MKTSDEVIIADPATGMEIADLHEGLANQWLGKVWDEHRLVDELEMKWLDQHGVSHGSRAPAEDAEADGAAAGEKFSHCCSSRLGSRQSLYRMNLQEISQQFLLPGEVESVVALDGGLINATHVVRCVDGTRFILQALNAKVFPKPEEVMDNIQLVTGHLERKGERTLSLVGRKDGGKYHKAEGGVVWRCYEFLEGMESFDRITSPEMAYKAAAGFGRFQKSLADLDAGRLHETIPGFHDTGGYLKKLWKAAKEDGPGRVAGVGRELEIIGAREGLADALSGGGLPLRITHNDTKISNILFPMDGRSGPVVIDLDTVMPGLAGHDYGDLVRSAAASAGEEADPAEVWLDPERVSALKEGYLSAAADFLMENERATLDVSVKVITLELAIRFLTDHLLGDVYFKTDSPGQNLRRARNQLALLESA